jgi:hypothetical protein
MNNSMTFNQAMFSLADGWLLYWLYWLGYSIVLTPLFVYLPRIRLHRCRPMACLSSGITVLALATEPRLRK